VKKSLEIDIQIDFSQNAQALRGGIIRINYKNGLKIANPLKNFLRTIFLGSRLCF